jgi:hypothetical protein
MASVACGEPQLSIMKTIHSLFLIPAASLLFAIASSAGGCSTTASFVFPTHAVAVTTLPTGVPTTCDANTYYYVDSGGACAAGTWYLCGDSGYTEYDCDDPGSGWTVASGSPSGPITGDDAGDDSGPKDDAGGPPDASDDAMASPDAEKSDAGSDDGGSTEDGGSTNDGGSTEDAGSSDAAATG